MQLNKKFWMIFFVLGLFTLWYVIPTYRKYQADRLVDKLCAKNGGIKVYEKVFLSKKEFNQFGVFREPEYKNMNPNDEYYRTWTISNLKGRYESQNIAALVIYSHHLRAYRKFDKKLLGEAISYVRRGGDPIGYGHPSTYSCPNSIDIALSKNIFLGAK